MHITDEMRMMKPGDSKTFPGARYGYVIGVARSLNKSETGKYYMVERNPFCCTLKCLYHNDKEQMQDSDD